MIAASHSLEPKPVSTGPRGSSTTPWNSWHSVQRIDAEEISADALGDVLAVGLVRPQPDRTVPPEPTGP